MIFGTISILPSNYLSTQKFSPPKADRTVIQPEGLTKYRLCHFLTHGRALKKDKELDKGGPIALADYYIVNEGSVNEFKDKVFGDCEIRDRN